MVPEAQIHAPQIHGPELIPSGKNYTKVTASPLPKLDSVTVRAVNISHQKQGREEQTTGSRLETVIWVVITSPLLSGTQSVITAFLKPSSLPTVAEAAPSKITDAKGILVLCSD